MASIRNYLPLVPQFKGLGGEGLLIKLFLSKPLPPILELPPLLSWVDEVDCPWSFLRPVGQWSLGQVVGAGPC